MNGLVCGALFRPLPGEIKSRKKNKNHEKDRLLGSESAKEGVQPPSDVSANGDKQNNGITQYEV